MDSTTCIILKTRQGIINFITIPGTSSIIQSIKVGSSSVYADTSTLLCTKECWDALFAIFRRHGPNLRHISFENIRIAREDLFNLIGCCSQYESLELQWVFSNAVAVNVMEYGDVNQKFKEITMKYCDDKIQSLILTLPRNTVTSFDFFCSSNVYLKQFFEMQQNVKKVSLRFYHENVNLCSLLPKKLESLEFGCYGNQCSLVAFFPRTNNLEHLDLSCAKINDHVFMVACATLQLRCFKVSVNRISTAAFRHIYKLKQLEELTLIKNDRNPERHLGILAASNLKKIRKLELLYPTTLIKMEVYKALTTNFPLQNLHISSIISSQSLHVIINHSPSLHTLKVQDPRFTLLSSMEFAKVSTTYLVNQNLQELTLEIDSELIMHVGKIFPNLRKLQFKTSLKSEWLYVKVLTELKNLTELRIDNKTAVDLMKPSISILLRQHGSRFKYISLSALPSLLLQKFYDQTFVEIKQDQYITELFNYTPRLELHARAEGFQSKFIV